MSADTDKDYQSVRKRLEEADAAYHQRDDPIMPDADYDALRAKLNRMEDASPHLADADSPSQKTGASPASGYARYRHLRPMLSLDNAFDEEDVDAFIERLQKTLAEEELVFCASPKIDGVAANLLFENGRLTRGATRGDGQWGEDITANLARIPDIGQSLRGSGWPDRIEIRGEIHMYRSEFEQRNADAAAKGERVFANPRNAAAGAIRQISLDVRSRPLHFCAYDWASPAPIAATASEAIEHLRQWGLLVIDEWRLLDDRAALHACFRDIEQRRAMLDYEIDGVVFALNNLAQRELLGATARSPRWAIARKFPADTAITRIRDISVQIGRTGSLTPVAHLEPVGIGGVSVSNASLHNEDEIRRKDIRPGDWVMLRRAGDVIPQIIRVLLERRATDSAPYVFPDACPACGEPVERDKDADGQQIGARSRCTASFTCPAQRQARLEHFVSRKAFDIEGLGPKQIALFIEKDLITEPQDIFDLRENITSGITPLDQWPGFGSRSADNLFKAIEARRTIGFARFLNALGIRHAGETNATLIATHFGSFPAFLDAMSAAADDDADTSLTAIDGIGPETAHAVAASINDPRQKNIITALTERITIEDATQTSATGTPLAGKTLVFTGTLSGQSRAQATARATELGARVTSSLSATTDYLVAGDKAGGKLAKARSLGIDILDDTAWNRIAAPDAPRKLL